MNGDMNTFCSRPQARVPDRPFTWCRQQGAKAFARLFTCLTHLQSQHHSFAAWDTAALSVVVEGAHGLDVT